MLRFGSSKMRVRNKVQRGLGKRGLKLLHHHQKRLYQPTLVRAYRGINRLLPFVRRLDPTQNETEVVFRAVHAVGLILRVGLYVDLDTGFIEKVNGKRVPEVVRLGKFIFIQKASCPDPLSPEEAFSRASNCIIACRALEIPR